MEVSPEGLRSAAASGDGLADELAASPKASESSGGVPTAAAVRAVHALVSGVRGDYAAYLAQRSGSLSVGANGYENTDDRSAGNIAGTM